MYGTQNAPEMFPPWRAVPTDRLAGILPAPAPTYNAFCYNLLEANCLSPLDATRRAPVLSSLMALKSRKSLFAALGILVAGYLFYHFRGSLHLSLDGARWCGEHDAKRDIAAVDLQIFDKAERDDVFVQIRILDLPQSLEHNIFTQLRHERIMPPARDVCRTRCQKPARKRGLRQLIEPSLTIGLPTLEATSPLTTTET